jgi:hypothetical protein
MAKAATKDQIAGGAIGDEADTDDVRCADGRAVKLADVCRLKGRGCLECPGRQRSIIMIMAPLWLRT